MSSSTSKTSQKRNKWAIDLNRRDKNNMLSSNDLQLLGYSERQISVDANSRENNPDLIAKVLNFPLNNSLIYRQFM